MTLLTWNFMIDGLSKRGDKMSKTFVISDLHLCHNKDFIYAPRGFSSVEEQNAEIIKRWNSVVSDNDNVIILGDLMLNDNEKGIECLKKLKGHKAFIRGNHDTDKRIELYNEIGMLDLGYAWTMKHKGYTFYLSHYPSCTSNYDIDKPLKARVINLCGHCHYKDKFAEFDKQLSYHCDADALDCYPIELDTIIEEIKAKLKEG